MDDLALNLFSAARERYEAAIRWQAVALVALLGFHLTILMPYAELTAEKANLVQALDHQKRMGSIMNDLAVELTKLKDETLGRARALAADTLAELRGGFAELDAIVADLHEHGAESRSDAPVPFAPPNISMQMPLNIAAPSARQVALPPQQPAVPGRALVPLDPDLRKRIAATHSQGELLAIIRPYVEANIVSPAFERFSRIWRAEALPKVEVTVGRIQQLARKARDADPAHAHVAVALADASATVLSEARQLRLEPGGNPYWWETVPGKGAALDVSLQGISQRVDHLAPINLEIHALTSQVEQLLSEKQRLLDESEKRIKELDQRFHEQQEKVASFAAPLKAISLDLAVVAPIYPLLLGAMLAALIAWPASRLLQLRDTVSLLTHPDQARIAKAWLLSRAGRSKRCIDVSLAAAAVAGWLWVTMSGLQLWAFPGTDRQRLVTFVGAAAALIIAAVIFRRRACLEALRTASA